MVKKQYKCVFIYEYDHQNDSDDDEDEEEKQTYTMEQEVETWIHSIEGDNIKYPYEVKNVKVEYNNISFD